MEIEKIHEGHRLLQEIRNFECEIRNIEEAIFQTRDLPDKNNDSPRVSGNDQLFRFKSRRIFISKEIIINELNKQLKNAKTNLETSKKHFKEL